MPPKTIPLATNCFQNAILEIFNPVGRWRVVSLRLSDLMAILFCVGEPEIFYPELGIANGIDRRE